MYGIGIRVQPPKYLIIVVNRFRYINNNFVKDRCSIPMDMTVVLGLHKFSLQATIDHHGASMYSGHYATSINCCRKQSNATTAKLRSLKWLIPKAPLLLMWQCINWLHCGFQTRAGGWEFWLLPWGWHTLFTPLKAVGRSKRRNLWIGLCVSSWRPWSVYSIDYIHTTHYSCILSNWTPLCHVHIPY